MTSLNAKRGRFFLGVNCAHDAAACIVSEAGIHVAIREERLTRHKHHEGFPRSAIEYCLAAVGLDSLDEIAGATINQYPKMDCQFDLRDMGYQGPLHTNASHHMLHAYYAHYFMGQDGLIVVADGSGYHFAEYKRTESKFLGDLAPDGDADEAHAVFEVRNGRLELLQRRWGVWSASTPHFRFPSLGHFYAAAAQYIFGNVRSWVYAGKVMGLAPFGKNPSGLPSAMAYENGEFQFDLEWVRRLPKVEDRSDYWNDPLRQDIAGRIQLDLEDALVGWLGDLSRDYGASALCLTGGVAHNSVANGKVARSGNYSKCYFTPAADDSGTAIGGALYAFEHHFQRLPASAYASDFHGRSYGQSEIEAAIGKDNRLVLTQFADVNEFASDAASSLEKGAIVALYDGASEFGARSLGHRSIFCDPRLKDGRERLNRKVKFREPYRPYAVIVLEERAEDFFDITGLSPYMMMVAEIKPQFRDLIPAACHVDGTCRLQTVGSDYVGRASLILKAFSTLANIPMLLNTSLNIRGEPIVESPAEAIECMCTSGIDALYIYPYKIEKHHLSWDLDDLEMINLIPKVGAGFRLNSNQSEFMGGWNDCTHSIRYRTGREVILSTLEFEILKATDGNTSVGTLLRGAVEPRELMATMQRLVEMGVIAFAKGSTRTG
jgi:carbamoyltransferase